MNVAARTAVPVKQSPPQPPRLPDLKRLQSDTAPLPLLRPRRQGGPSLPIHRKHAFGISGSPAFGDGGGGGGDGDATAAPCTYYPYHGTVEKAGRSSAFERPGPPPLDHRPTTPRRTRPCGTGRLVTVIEGNEQPHRAAYPPARIPAGAVARFRGGARRLPKTLDVDVKSTGSSSQSTESVFLEDDEEYYCRYGVHAPYGNDAVNELLETQHRQKPKPRMRERHVKAAVQQETESSGDVSLECWDGTGPRGGWYVSEARASPEEEIDRFYVGNNYILDYGDERRARGGRRRRRHLNSSELVNVLCAASALEDMLDDSGAYYPDETYAEHAIPYCYTDVDDPVAGSPSHASVFGSASTPGRRQSGNGNSPKFRRGAMAMAAGFRSVEFDHSAARGGGGMSEPTSPANSHGSGVRSQRQRYHHDFSSSNGVGSRGTGTPASDSRRHSDWTNGQQRFVNAEGRDERFCDGVLEEECQCYYAVESEAATTPSGKSRYSSTASAKRSPKTAPLSLSMRGCTSNSKNGGSKFGIDSSTMTFSKPRKANKQDQGGGSGNYGQAALLTAPEITYPKLFVPVGTPHSYVHDKSNGGSWAATDELIAATSAAESAYLAAAPWDGDGNRHSNKGATRVNLSLFESNSTSSPKSPADDSNNPRVGKSRGGKAGSASRIQSPRKNPGLNDWYCEAHVCGVGDTTQCCCSASSGQQRNIEELRQMIHTLTNRTQLLEERLCCAQMASVDTIASKIADRLAPMMGYSSEQLSSSEHAGCEVAKTKSLPAPREHSPPSPSEVRNMVALQPSVTSSGGEHQQQSSSTSGSNPATIGTSSIITQSETTTEEGEGGVGGAILVDSAAAGGRGVAKSGSTYSEVTTSRPPPAPFSSAADTAQSPEAAASAAATPRHHFLVMTESTTTTTSAAGAAGVIVVPDSPFDVVESPRTQKVWENFMHAKQRSSGKDRAERDRGNSTRPESSGQGMKREVFCPLQAHTLT